MKPHDCTFETLPDGRHVCFECDAPKSSSRVRTPIIGKTYKGTIAETKFAKNRGGYFTGYRTVATGKVFDVTCRADSDQGGIYWGEWIETCGTRRKVRAAFHQEMFDRLQLITS